MASQNHTARFGVVSPASGGSLTLAGERTGQGPPLVLLHGLTATKRNVVHGSRHLVRRGFELVGYDARGHGESDPPSDRTDYEYPRLVGDLRAVLDELRLERPVMVGSSMGSATAMALALEEPDRLAGLVQITPAHVLHRTDPDELARWHRLADALEEGGIDRFMEVSGVNDLEELWREPARRATRQCFERHRDLGAVADALRVVPASEAFADLDLLKGVELPVLVIGSRDAADPLHPLELARDYAKRLPNAELVVEDEGSAPLAWQGGRLSRAIADWLERALPSYS